MSNVLFGPTPIQAAVAHIACIVMTESAPVSHPLSIARVRQALKLNDREKLRQEFQETAPSFPFEVRPVSKPADYVSGACEDRRHSDGVAPK